MHLDGTLHHSVLTHQHHRVTTQALAYFLKLVRSNVVGTHNQDLRVNVEKHALDAFTAIVDQSFSEETPTNAALGPLPLRLNRNPIPLSPSGSFALLSLHSLRSHSQKPQTLSLFPRRARTLRCRSLAKFKEDANTWKFDSLVQIRHSCHYQMLQR
ncbi:hypothetical protein F0562_001063 [Nyssa sinensis]|uniref:Uncharacterized protein n=1 Tax=Nyssa sinensis TaxID=561372 RepID=A0A5J5C2G4_9ASTE|nr:hypothetical protein F0562_001063 [Nyssa sinensis]